MSRKNYVAMAIILAFGILLNGLYFAGMVDDFWSGLGTAFIFVAVLRFVRLIKYKNNSQYREKVDTEANDERNKYLSMKAWAWTGYVFVLISAAAALALRAMGENELSSFASGSCCLMLLLYVANYFILKRKY